MMIAIAPTNPPVHAPSSMIATYGPCLLILWLVFFVLGVVVRQGSMIQHELWMLQRHPLGLRPANRPDRPPQP